MTTEVELKPATKVNEKEQHQKRILSSFNASWTKLEKMQFPITSLRNHLANIRLVAALQPEITIQLKEMEQRAQQQLTKREEEDRIAKEYIEGSTPSVSTTVEQSEDLPVAARATVDVEPISLGERINQAKNDVRNLLKGKRAK